MNTNPIDDRKAEASSFVSPEAEAEMMRLAEQVRAQRMIRSDEARYQAMLARQVRRFRESYEGKDPLHQVTCPGCREQPTLT